LAYGSAHQSVENSLIYLQKSIKITCAVIGSGIIGLFTALELSQKGFNVSVYSEKIPKID
jgi:heterodisulfide reductase subunit A-like polyferredoxin